MAEKIDRNTIIHIHISDLHTYEDQKNVYNAWVSDNREKIDKKEAYGAILLQWKLGTIGIAMKRVRLIEIIKEKGGDIDG